MYNEDLRQEERLAVFAAKQKYGKNLSIELEGKIRANARKNFLSRFVYGGVVSIPLLRQCNSTETQEAKKAASTVSVEENFEDLSSLSTGEDETLNLVANEEISDKMQELAPATWGLINGDFTPEEVSKKNVFEEIIYLLSNITDLPGKEILSLADEAAGYLTRKPREENKKNPAPKKESEKNLEEINYCLF
ncbi:hypothetical protein [Galenea microaerophila]